MKEHFTGATSSEGTGCLILPFRLRRFTAFHSKCPATVISVTFVCRVCNHLKAKLSQ